MALRFLLRFPAFSQKERNGPFFTFPWRFQKFLTALPPMAGRAVAVFIIIIIIIIIIFLSFFLFNFSAPHSTWSDLNQGQILPSHTQPNWRSFADPIQLKKI